ncbi:hypothetical protein Tco_1012589, partial [Tanacetum coccineum]
RSKAFLCSWDELAVRVQSFILNPSPPFLFVHHLTIKGGLGLSKLPSGKGYRGIGLWEMVRGELGDVLGGGIGYKPWGRLAENWLYTGLGLGLQSLHSPLSIAHKWAVEIDCGPFGLHSLHMLYIGLSRLHQMG